MRKGTRMIILTKNNLLRYSVVVLLLILCISILLSIAEPKHQQAFIQYEKILSKELIPAGNKEEKKLTGEKILKHIFKFKQITAPEPTAAPEPVQEPPLPLLSSEPLTINKGLEIRNATAYPININDYIKKDISFKGKANILIMHTHTTESFAKMQYTKDAPDRNLDENCNMTAVGKAMNEVFQKNGINCVHDTTVHDYPSYNKAYQMACSTIEKNLKQDNSINIVLDVHRDGITRDDGTKVKLITDITGVPTAQIMLVVGTNTNLTHDNWKDNLAFAAQIQSKAIDMFPGLMRPIDIRKERFNQQLTKGSVIIEVGANGNTLEEAIAGGMAIAEVISAVVK